MIKPANDLIMLSSVGGSSDLLSLDLLEEDLSCAIAKNRCGSQELIDSVIEIVNVFLAGKRDQNEMFSLAEVETFIVRLFIDAGLSNVATTLCEQRKIKNSQINFRDEIESGNCNVIKQREIPFLVDRRSACLIHHGTLSIKPISLLLPIVQINISIDKFIESLFDACVLELSVYPEFDALCDHMFSAVKALEREIRNRATLLTDVNVRMDLLCKHLSPSNRTLYYDISDLRNIALHKFAKIDHFSCKPVTL